MPKLACNGFSMFANHWRPKLEARQGRKFGGMEELIAAANPLWSQVPEEEKREWKERAKDYKKTEEYYERKRAFRRRAGKPLRDDKLGKPAADNALPEFEDDYDSDFDPGVPMVRGPLSAVAPPILLPPASDLSPLPLITLPPSPPSSLSKKLESDKARLRAFLLAQCGGGERAALLSALKKCRWLQVSMQTYGELPGMPGRRVPAELALVEWSLSGGIEEEYFRILGPWSLGEVADAATTRAAESHGVPLGGCPEFGEFTMSRRSVLRNVLGRTEPGIAVGQGLGVGLYDGAQSLDGVVLPGEASGRRWLVVLGREWEDVMAGVSELAEEEQIEYEGIPVGGDRYVVAEAVAGVLAELAGSPLPSPVLLGGPGRWDEVEGMYCSFHAPERNTHCAISTARKTLFSLFALLKAPFDLPFHV